MRKTLFVVGAVVAAFVALMAVLPIRMDVRISWQPTSVVQEAQGQTRCSLFSPDIRRCKVDGKDHSCDIAWMVCHESPGRP